MAEYTIVGNSIAANSAAARIVSLDPGARVTLISDEPEPYYSRCALMYYAMDHCWERDIYIADRIHYERLHAEVVHDRVVGVDTENHELALESGDKRDYEKLLLAVGASPRRMGIEGEDAEGVYDFTTLEHARKVRADAEKCERAAVVGGGLIGSEVAEVFHKLGLHCDYFVKESTFFPAFCSADQSRIIVRRFGECHINVHMSRTLDRIHADDDGRITAATDTEGDRHEMELLVRAIGVTPRTEFLEGSGVGVDRGILVDDTMRTSAPDVWAAGDCAEVRFAGKESSVIQKLWYTAQPMGWIAGAQMAGADDRYEETIAYLSAMFMDLDFAGYGEMPAPWNGLQEVSLTAPNDVDSARIVHDGEKVVGITFLGTALTKEDCEHLVLEEMPVETACDTVRALYEARMHDRAPKARIARRRRLSRRPPFWPFGKKKTWRV